MGSTEVQKISAAQTQQAQVVDEKVKADRKAAEEKKAKQELSQALAKNPKKANNAEEAKAKLLEMHAAKKAGKLDNGDKLMIGAVALGAIATVAKIFKPSLGKLLKGGAKMLKPAAAAAPSLVKGGLKPAHGLMAVGGLVGASILGGCNVDDLFEEEHNHYVPLPTDTVVKDNYIEKIIERPVYVTKYDTIYKTDTVPGEPIIVEKTDTIWQTDTIKVPEYITETDTIWKTDTIKVPEIITETDTIYKTDTIRVPEIIEKTDTIYKTDTIKVPEIITETDTIWKTDTVIVPEYITKTDTIYKTDTIKVPEIVTETDTIWKTDTVTVPEYITKTDTVYKTDTITVPEYITKNDTIYETITDTVYQTKTDTIQLPGETIYINEEFDSKIPEKMKEMFHDLGIDTTGVGKFVYGVDYQDMKNSKVHQSMWDGGRTSRDGNVYVMNDIMTGWDHEGEKYTFGKNETFARHDLYINSNQNLGDDINVPLAPIEVSNNRNTPNWSVFASGSTTAEPGNWQRETTRTFKKIAPGKWQSSDGFTYEKGHKPNSIKKTNQYGSEWLLENVNVYGSNVAKDPKEKK